MELNKKQHNEPASRGLILNEMQQAAVEHLKYVIQKNQYNDINTLFNQKLLQQMASLFYAQENSVLEHIIQDDFKYNYHQIFKIINSATLLIIDEQRTKEYPGECLVEEFVHILQICAGLSALTLFGVTYVVKGLVDAYQGFMRYPPGNPTFVAFCYNQKMITKLLLLFVFNTFVFDSEGLIDNISNVITAQIGLFSSITPPPMVESPGAHAVSTVISRINHYSLVYSVLQQYGCLFTQLMGLQRKVLQQLDELLLKQIFQVTLSYLILAIQFEKDIYIVFDHGSELDLETQQLIQSYTILSKSINDLRYKHPISYANNMFAGMKTQFSELHSFWVLDHDLCLQLIKLGEEAYYLGGNSINKHILALICSLITTINDTAELGDQPSLRLLSVAVPAILQELLHKCIVYQQVSEGPDSISYYLHKNYFYDCLELVNRLLRTSASFRIHVPLDKGLVPALINFFCELTLYVVRLPQRQYAYILDNVVRLYFAASRNDVEFYKMCEQIHWLVCKMLEQSEVKEWIMAEANAQHKADCLHMIQDFIEMDLLTDDQKIEMSYLNDELCSIMNSLRQIVDGYEAQGE